MPLLPRRFERIQAVLNHRMGDLTVVLEAVELLVVLVRVLLVALVLLFFLSLPQTIHLPQQVHQRLQQAAQTLLFHSQVQELTQHESFR
jgi:hypothetical protein